MKKIRTVIIIALCIVSTSAFSQTKNQKMTNQSIVRTFLAGFNDVSKVADSFALLADNYHFTDPTASVNSKAEFIELSKTLDEVLTGVEVVRMAENGDWVAVHYLFKSSIEGLEVNKGNEWFRIENGKIQESHLVFDATHWQKVFEQAKH